MKIEFNRREFVSSLAALPLAARAASHSSVRQDAA